MITLAAKEEGGIMKLSYNDLGQRYQRWEESDGRKKHLEAMSARMVMENWGKEEGGIMDAWMPSRL